MLEGMFSYGFSSIGSLCPEAFWNDILHADKLWFEPNIRHGQNRPEDVDMKILN